MGEGRDSSWERSATEPIRRSVPTDGSVQNNRSTVRVEPPVPPAASVKTSGSAFSIPFFVMPIATTTGGNHDDAGWEMCALMMRQT